MVDVAIIDGGVNIGHDDLSSNYETFIKIKRKAEEETFVRHRSWNFESDKYDQFDGDFFKNLSMTNQSLYKYYFGHGTAVAHILTTCIPACRFYSLKMPFDFILDDDKVQRKPIPRSKIEAEIEEKYREKRRLFEKMRTFLVKHDLKVANCSWTERFEDVRDEVGRNYPFLREDDCQEIAVIQMDLVVRVLDDFFKSEDLREKTLFVVAAGNHNVNLETNPVFPANYECENVLTVGGTDGNGDWWTDRADFGSNYSPRYVDIATHAEKFRVAWGENVFETKSGTSMATPVISSLVLGILNKYPHLTPAKLKQAVLSSCEKKEPLANRVSEGRWFDAVRHIPGMTKLIERVR